MKQEPLKAGDRVRVYCREVGIRCGSVISHYPDGSLGIRLDQPAPFAEMSAFPQQCRRLIRRERRRLWVSRSVLESGQDARVSRTNVWTDGIEFIEVPKPKVKP